MQPRFGGLPARLPRARPHPPQLPPSSPRCCPAHSHITKEEFRRLMNSQMYDNLQLFESRISPSKGSRDGGSSGSVLGSMSGSMGGDGSGSSGSGSHD